MSAPWLSNWTSAVTSAWSSESKMYFLATVLILSFGGLFIFTPVAFFSILAQGPFAEFLACLSLLVGAISFVKALILQRKRYNDFNTQRRT